MYDTAGYECSLTPWHAQQPVYKICQKNEHAVSCHATNANDGHIADMDYTKQRRIDTTPNNLTVYFVADMVCGRYGRTP